MPLDLYWGPAQVVHVRKQHGPLLPDDLRDVDLTRAPRLLVRTTASDLAPDEFPEDIVYPDPSLGTFLFEAGIVLFGSDAPSMDALDSKELPGHNALGARGIAILENLALSGVDDGLYDLVALPLKVVGGDGSPVRAVLRPR
jgi:arylformamidase